MHMTLSTLIQVETHHVKNMNCLLERERNYEHNRTKLGDEVILIRVPVPNGPKSVTEEEKRDEQWISWLVLDSDYQRKGMSTSRLRIIFTMSSSVHIGLPSCHAIDSGQFKQAPQQQ